MPLKGPFKHQSTQRVRLGIGLIRGTWLWVSTATTPFWRPPKKPFSPSDAKRDFTSTTWVFGQVSKLLITWVIAHL